MKYRMKKIMAAVTSAVLLAGGCPAGLADYAGTAAEVRAADHGEWVDYGDVGDFSYSVYEDGSVVIDEYHGNATELTIPSMAGGKQVTEIRISYIEDKGRITKVTVPEGVKVIGSYCFSDFSGLTDISLPSTLTSIEDGAFSDCSSLQSIRLPDSVADMGTYVFDGCISLDTVNIPAGVTEISSYQFSGASLKTITIPGTVTRIGVYAFSNQSGLKSVTISDGVTEIGDNAFYNCGITNLEIPGSVKRIGKYAFDSCEYLTGVTLQNGVGRIEECAFYNCSGLTSITIPGSVGIIDKDAFYKCKGLTDVVIQEGVTTIGEAAFSACDNLATVTVPDSVTAIGSYAFGYGDTVKLVCNTGSYAHQYAVKNGYNSSQAQQPGVTPPGNTPGAPVADPFPAGRTYTKANGIYVSLGNGKAAYKAPVNKKASSATVLNSVKVNGKTCKVTQINAKAFSGCSKLKKITVKAKSLTKVGSKALKGIYKKAIIKVPKAKRKAYTKLFKGKGQAKTVKIK